MLFNFFGTVSYTIGCIFFTVNTIKQEPKNKILLAGCIFFDIGSILYLIDYIN